MKKLFFTFIIIAIALVSTSCRYIGDAQDTAFKEFKASTLLKKYEWFKDAAAQLDKKVADISVYEVRINELKADYDGKPRSEWAREDREQVSVWNSEVAGVKASYNLLASEYNAQMAKFNWAFCNAGTLPAGATAPLPRDYKPYISE